ncbi:hypothetical protein [Flavobacterium sp. LC2016-01]|uniref:hypothetical protein n=1 Tax=Flavobacterium sp. LC2016-01 TaxID=2675876 RepID=UPI0012BA7CDD|nr:hypothetical protein [Flavobacterium sp. LC2016-01]MTH15725.1 hypothetical protein [Flavobacterium sp. LC2016-01]
MIKKIFSFLFLIFIIGCQNKKESQVKNSLPVKTDLSLNSENEDKTNALILKKYQKEGILLNGQIKFYDDKLNQTGSLEIDIITKVQILEKSTEQYNIEKSTDYCFKSNFIKIKYKDNDYLVFGQDIYEINQNDKHDVFFNDNLTILTIRNFEMGASDEEGLTDCDDYDYLLVFNKQTNQYSTIGIPENQKEVRNQKFASLTHDDGSSEEIYSCKTINDTLILGIKISYQDGYGSCFLKTSIKEKFIKSIITNKNQFDDDDIFKNLK